MRQFAKSATVSAVRSAWPVLPLAVSRAMLGLVKLEVDEPVEVSDERAVCCISVDFDATREGRLELNRKGTRTLVELAMRHGIPMTWAICGKTAEEDPHSYEMILDSDVPHEIGVHTYSHVDVSACTEDELVSEVEKCVGVLGLKNRPKTFVFPWNREAHFETLAGLGFTAYRGQQRGIGRPSKASGLWNIRPVCYLGDKAFGTAPYLTRLMDLCESRRTVFHMWLHPWSVVEPSSESYEVSVLEPLFGHIDRLREEGRLDVMTMGQVATSLDEPDAHPAERNPSGLAKGKVPVQARAGAG